MAANYGELENIVLALAPIDTTSSAVASAYVDLDTAHEVSFLAYWGALTAASADDTVGPTFTMEASTAAASNATESTFAFNYRLSSATGTNTWGAITAAAATGVAIPIDGDGKALLIQVDPATVAAIGADYRYVRLVCTPNAQDTATPVAAVAFINPRYKQATMVAAG